MRDEQTPQDVCGEAKCPREQRTVIPGRNWKKCLCKVSEGINKVYCGLYENGENQKLLGPSAPTCKITGFRALEKRGYGAVLCSLNNRPWRGWRGEGEREGLPIMVYTEWVIFFRP